MRVDIPSDSNCSSEPVFYAADKVDSTSGLVIELFGDSDEVCADALLLHGCPHSSMPNPVEGLLEIYEGMEEVLLVLGVFLTDMSKICYVVLHPAPKPACSSAMNFSACSFNLFNMIFSMTLLGWLIRLIVR